jgi:hypothetical protein
MVIGLVLLLDNIHPIIKDGVNGNTGWTNNRLSYMPTPYSQPENSKVMEMLRTMQIQQQNFTTLQEEGFATLQEQIQSQGDYPSLPSKRNGMRT